MKVTGWSKVKPLPPITKKVEGSKAMTAFGTAVLNKGDQWGTPCGECSPGTDDDVS